ncbi:flagellar motor switch protein [Clostridium acetobutylicum EA 2018]|uniref:flagellar motor switch phosphatase FliY n=1 Tax=Clostridium acetobutylicum TaxID=1488 RepID=UPI000200A6EC|nr:flagellar motor switch phosphatase FliY [Clostridium acetobutylicum]ADZ21266.1 flagellar motor switch protein [Clostridium acetobutylicum EA 2018]
MSDGFLSQEEIDSLLNGGDSSSDSPEEQKENTASDNDLNDIEKDLLGEIGNISMGSASTALSTIIGQKVNITTPIVSVTTLETLKKNFEVPNVALDVKYVSGISGENLLVMKVTDAAVIANLMMGGDGKVESKTLSEIELSAVSEAMNQMIGSAATSMATMLLREVNISPPVSKIWDSKTDVLTDNIKEDENIVQVAFKLTIGDLVDSQIMQILPIDTSRKMIDIMMGGSSNKEEPEVQQSAAPSPEPTVSAAPVNQTPSVNEPAIERPMQQSQQQQMMPQGHVYGQPQVEVNRASFQPLEASDVYGAPKNIDLILDVPLEISVVLGRAKKNIKDILNLGTGSLIELDKLAEEPVEILVNGKKVAYGEVVVVDENFGVRITSIVNSEERIKSLKK